SLRRSGWPLKLLQGFFSDPLDGSTYWGKQTKPMRRGSTGAQEGGNTKRRNSLHAATRRSVTEITQPEKYSTQSGSTARSSMGFVYNYHFEKGQPMSA